MSIWFFFQLWCEACSFAKIFPRKTVPHVLKSKKTCNDIWRRLVQKSASELRYLTILCNFAWCRYQNNPCLSWSLCHVVFSTYIHIDFILGCCCIAILKNCYSSVQHFLIIFGNTYAIVIVFGWILIKHELNPIKSH